MGRLGMPVRATAQWVAAAGQSSASLADLRYVTDKIPQQTGSAPTGGPYKRCRGHRGGDRELFNDLKSLAAERSKKDLVLGV
jgi:hypothetical protein